MNVLKWKHATTYADAPHEYITVDKARDTYLWFLKQIKAHGVRETFVFRGKTYRYTYYYAGDGYKYWVIGPVLNRARVPGQKRKQIHLFTDE